MTSGYLMINVGEIVLEANQPSSEIPNIYDTIEGATKPIVISGDIEITNNLETWRITAPCFVQPYIFGGIIYINLAGRVITVNEDDTLTFKEEL